MTYSAELRTWCQEYVKRQRHGGLSKLAELSGVAAAALARYLQGYDIRSDTLDRLVRAREKCPLKPVADGTVVVSTNQAGITSIRAGDKELMCTEAHISIRGSEHGTITSLLLQTSPAEWGTDLRVLSGHIVFDHVASNVVARVLNISVSEAHARLDAEYRRQIDGKDASDVAVQA